MVAAAGCGILPGLPGSGDPADGAGAAPAPVLGGGEQPGGTTSGPGSSLTEPVPFGESKTVVSTNDGVEWEITVTGFDDTTSRTAIDDEPCVLVKGTATLVTLPDGGESEALDIPLLQLVDSEGGDVQPELCDPNPKDLGLTLALDIKGEVGDTVEWGDTYAKETGADAPALLAVQNVLPGAYFEDIYFAIE